MAQASGRLNVLCADTNEQIFSLTQYFESKHWRHTIQHYLDSDLPKQCYVCKTQEIVPIHFHHRTKIRMGHERLTDIMPICSACFNRCREDKGRKSGKKKAERFLLQSFRFDPRTLSNDDRNWLLNIHPHKRSHVLGSYFRKRAEQYHPSSQWVNQQVKYTCKWIHKLEKEIKTSLFQDV